MSIKYYLEIVQELSECHFCTIGLNALHLKAVPKRPINLIVLRKKASVKKAHSYSKRRQLCCCNGQCCCYLVLGSSYGLREGEERQSKVHEAVLVGLELLVPLNDLQ